MYKMLKCRAVALGKAERVNELYAGVITKQLRHREEQNKGTRAVGLTKNNLAGLFKWRKGFSYLTAEILGFSL